MNVVMDQQEAAEHLAKCVRMGTVQSEARALLDFGCMSKPVRDWIASHEVLRKRLNEANAERMALRDQVKELNNRLLAPAGNK